VSDTPLQLPIPDNDPCGLGIDIDLGLQHRYLQMR
jgi:hypothetical protein